ncbi:hypothetical protein AGMMS4952_12640 [Spirochaetia bacterium]|nr:hypothetical protein AGMMS4952_12640 [Spirochaetia bacterium]
MKKRKGLGIIGIALIFVFSLIGCQQVSDPLSSDAVVTEIKVAEVAATLKAPGTTSFGTELGVIYLSASQMQDAAIKVAAPEGAIIYYAAEKPSVDPYFGTTSVLTFEDGDILWVEVFSANHDEFWLYAVKVLSSQPTLSDITLAGRSATGGSLPSGIPIPAFGTGLGIPGTAWNDAAIQEGTVWFGTSQGGTPISLAVTRDIESTTWKAGVAAAGTEPAFAEVSTITPVDGSFLYIETENPAGDKAYYKIKLIAKNDDRSLASVTINGTSLTIGTMGTSSFPGDEAYGNYSNGAELATTDDRSTLAVTALTDLAAVTVAATPTAGSTTVVYGATEWERNYLITYSSSGSLGKLKDGGFIALEVTSEIGEKGWYKFATSSFPALTGVSVNAGTPVVPGITAISNGTFGLNVGGAPAADVSLIDTPPFTSVSLSVTTETGFTPTVEWGIMVNNGMPATWTTGALTNVPARSTILIRVIDEDNLAGPLGHENRQYYRVRVLPPVSAEDAVVASVNLGGTSDFGTGAVSGGINVPALGLGTPNATIGSVIAGAVTITDAIAAGASPYPGAPITVGTNITLGANADSFQLAKTTGATPGVADWEGVTYPYGPTWPVNPAFGPITDGDVLWIEVSAGPYKQYYKIVATVQVLTASDAVLTALTAGIDATTYMAIVTASSLGTPAATIAGVTAPGAISFTAAQAVADDANYPVGGGPSIGSTVGPFASIRLAKTTGAAPADDAWQSPTTVPLEIFPGFVMDITINPTFGPLADNDVIFAEVKAGTFTNYYKIVVTVTP